MWVKASRAAAAALIVSAGALGLSPSAAADEAETARLEAMFEQPVEEAWFAPAFLVQVPVAQIRAIVEQLTGAYGPLAGVDEASDGYVLHLERADVPAQISFDAEGRVVSLWFSAPIEVGATVADEVAALTALPGAVAVLVLTDGEERVAVAADEPLAVGSAFKLAVLKAVADAVEAGRLAWDQVVALDEGWQSMPTGILQDWPADTPLTLATLAGLAVSVSDNTATDGLIHTVGRAAVEAITPRNTPFLTTRELFTLKSAGNEALRDAWLAGSTKERAQVVQQLATANRPTIEGFMAGARAPAIEWFFTARELCGLFDQVADLPAFRINPGLASPSTWRQVAFKGGSEPGVLNLSTRLVGEDGRIHCVVATWNGDGTLDEAAMAGPYQRLLVLVGR